MNEILFLIIAFIAGLALGTFFFGGLWLTVQKGLTSKIPVLLFFGSFFFRIGITLIGFYYVSAGNWKRLLVCLTGFVIARFIVLRLTKKEERKEAGNET